jgi:hypothetical protein
MKYCSFQSSRGLQTLLICLQTILIATTLACSSNETKVRQVIEDRLKNQGIRNLVLDFFHPSKKTPGKAYASATVTYNFATSSGAFQQEYLGFILKQEGQNWTIEQSTSYTKDPDKAENLIAGLKAELK